MSTEIRTLSPNLTNTQRDRLAKLLEEVRIKYFSNETANEVLLLKVADEHLRGQLPKKGIKGFLQTLPAKKFAGFCQTSFDLQTVRGRLEELR